MFKSVPLLVRVPPHHRFKTGILSTRSVSNKTCRFINTTKCFPLHFHSSEICVDTSNWDSYIVFFYWGGFLRFGQSIAAKDSHFANAVFAPKAVLQQNATGGDLRCCPFLL